jgi:hypothetical protein
MADDLVRSFYAVAAPDLVTEQAKDEKGRCKSSALG